MNALSRYDRSCIKGIPDPFKRIRTDCEKQSLCMSYLACAVINNTLGQNTLGMMMRKRKDAASYYSDLFD